MLYIFDMGGVVTTNADLYEKICDVLGISIEDFKKYSGIGEPNGTDLMGLCSNGEINAGDYWKIFAQRSGIAITTDWFHWLFHPILNEGTVKIIKELKQHGNRVVCGTNTISSHYYNHLERGDYSYFDQTYSSCNMGVSKPNADFWKIILTAENVQPKDVVFIDDVQENCDAAASLGIHAIHFTSAQNLASQLGLAI